MAKVGYTLGRLCVERGLITQDQLVRCLQIQKSGTAWRHLGEILLNEGLLTGIALANLLSLQESKRRGGASPGSRIEPPSNDLGWLLKEMRAYGADALVLGAGQPPCFRYGGWSEPMEGPPLDNEQIKDLLFEALPEGLLQRLDKQGFVDRTIEFAGHDRVRLTLYRHARGIGVVLRPQAASTLELNDLGLPAGIRDLVRPESGLVLIAGPLGSGRAVTLSALLQAILDARSCHAVTIERPVETCLEQRLGRVSRREVGRDAASFASAMRGALRANADVLAVGSMEEAETIETALGAASTGRLVIGLMHTNGAAATIRRVLDACAGLHARGARDLLASCLRGIVTQHRFVSRASPEPVLAGELMLCTPGVAHLIREGRVGQIPAILKGNRSEGMASLDDALADLCKAGRITAEEALARAVDPAELKRALESDPEVVRAVH